jgi:inorganic phosphate transporter, PiT family
MHPSVLLIAGIIFVALAFDFINGFHDAANSVATVVSTRVLSPIQAVAWAAFFNFVAVFSLGTGVANTVGQHMVNEVYVNHWVILAGLLGAISWDLFTWWLGLPTSSSHALLGGYAGAAISFAIHKDGWSHALDAIKWHGWIMTLIFIVAAPLLGLILAYVMMIAVYWLFRKSSPARMDKYFRRLQLVSAAMLSWSHGANDAQKTMGIITGLLVSTGHLKHFQVPFWVMLSAYAAISLGTLSGGWRIIHTMGSRLTRLKPRSGFCAETAAALSILLATKLHLPVSTTHVTAGAISGVGSIQRFKAVRWGVAANIAWAWILTIPASAIVGWLALTVMRIFVEV